MTASGAASPDAEQAHPASTERESARTRRINLAYLAAELERAAHEHRFAAADLDAIRLALLGGLISADQALGHIELTDHFRFFGALSQNGGP